MENKPYMPCQYKRGQVWSNPEDKLMIVTTVEDRSGFFMVYYTTEHGESGKFASTDKAIVDNITLHSAPAERDGVDVEKLKREILVAFKDEIDLDTRVKNPEKRLPTKDGLDTGRLILRVIDHIADQGYLQPQPRVEGKPAVFYCENGKSLDGLEQGALAVLSNLMMKTNATNAEFMIGNEKDGEFYFTCHRGKTPQSGDDAKADALEDVAYIRKTLGKTWINQMQRERVEEIHARLNKVEAALSAPVKPETIGQVSGEVVELKQRIQAAKERLRDAKAIHSNWYTMPKYEAEAYAQSQMSNIEMIIYSAIMYLDGEDGPNRAAQVKGER